MSTKEGIVIGVEGQIARVKTRRTRECESCSQSGSCGVLSTGKDIDIKAENVAGAKQGDQVIIRIDTSVVLKSSFLIYIVPVLFMIVGAFIGKEYAMSVGFDDTLFAILAGFIFFGLSLIFIRIISNKMAAKKAYLPKIIKIQRHGSACGCN